jgi:hypothetical protein
MSGTSGPTPILVSTQGAAAASSMPVTVNYSDDSASGNAGTPPSTSLTDRAIAELGKGHQGKHHQSFLKRPVRREAAHDHLNIREHHRKR